MFTVADSAAKLIVTLRQTVLCLLAMFELTEGDTRDVTFVQALPNEPLPLFYRMPRMFSLGTTLPN